MKERTKHWYRITCNRIISIPILVIFFLFSYLIIVLYYSENAHPILKYTTTGILFFSYGWCSCQIFFKIVEKASRWIFTKWWRFVSKEVE